MHTLEAWINGQYQAFQTTSTKIAWKLWHWLLRRNSFGIRWYYELPPNFWR